MSICRRLFLFWTVRRQTEIWILGCPVLLLISALFAVLRFGFPPFSRAERRRLCRARECRFVGLLAALARKVVTPCTGSLCFLLSAFTSRAASWARCRNRRSLCFSLNSGSALAFSAVPFCGFSRCLFSPFWDSGALRIEVFPLCFVCRETQDVDFFPLLFVDVVLQLLWSPVEFVVDHNWFC